jgi:transcriptional regulator with XRE-family HTH domain
MTFGERIRRLRTERGWTQIEFAQKMEVHDRHISRWEKDKNRPTGRAMDKMAEVFGVTVEELFGSPFAVEEKTEDDKLLQQFKEIQSLAEPERQAISLVIDAFLTKKRIGQLIQTSSRSA